MSNHSVEDEKILAESFSVKPRQKKDLQRRVVSYQKKDDFLFEDDKLVSEEPPKVPNDKYGLKPGEAVFSLETGEILARGPVIQRLSEKPKMKGKPATTSDKQSKAVKR